MTNTTGERTFRTIEAARSYARRQVGLIWSDSENAETFRVTRSPREAAELPGGMARWVPEVIIDEPTPYKELTKPIETALDSLQQRRDWRHVLAMMRLRHNETFLLDQAPKAFRALVKDACRSVAIGGEKAAEALARSFGL